MRYYWCVNCGYSHDFGKDRKRGVGQCGNCGYDDITELESDEWRLDEIIVKNKSILGDGRIFIDEVNANDKEEKPR